MFNTIISTGFLLPQSIIANGSVTGNSWGDPNNLLLVDGDVSTSDVGAGSSSDITVGNYNFNIPQGAVITGIEMQVIGYRGQQTSPVITLTPYFFDDTGNVDVFYPYITPFTGLTPTLATYTLGTQTYLFATSFTVDQINNAKFNLVANGDISLDSFLVNVYYYIPAPVTPPTPAAGECIDCDSPIQVQAMYLELPFLVGDTKFYLKAGSFSYPDGTPVQPGDLGSCGGTIPFVFDESKRKANGQNFEENAMLDTALGGTWTVLPSGVIEVDLGVVTQRGLDFKTPATHVSALMSDHDANSKVVISNNEPYNLKLVRRCQVDTVFSPPIATLKDDNLIEPATHAYNFKGSGVAVVPNPGDSQQMDVTIPGFSAIPPAVVNSVSFTSGNVQVNNLTQSFLVTGTDRYLTLSVTMEAGITATATWNGVPMVAISSSTIGTFVVRTYDLVAPDLGTHDLILTFSGSTYMAGGLVQYSQVNQVTPRTAAITSSGNSNLITISPTTTTTNSVVFHGAGTRNFPILYTAGGGESLITNTVTGVVQSGIENQTVGTPALVTSQISLSAVADWADVAFGINGIQPFVSTLEVDDEGVPVELATGKMDFVGPGVTVTPGVPGEVIVTIGSGSGSRVDQTPDNGTYGLLAGAVDGVNTTFTVANGSYITGTLVVYRNGLVQLQGAGDDFVETNPALGTFDFVVPPILGDIITVSYQTSGGGPGNQDGIQFEDEGVALGTPGTVNEVDFVGAGVTAVRVLDKVTVTIPGSGPSTDELVGATATDTTPDFLDPKLEIVSADTSVTVVKTIQNPGGNEKISYDLSVSPAGGSEKKVGVGATNDINWINMQYQFDSDNVSGGDKASMWDVTGGSASVLNPMHINLQGADWFGVNTAQYSTMLPFQSTFNTTKQVIFQIIASIAPTTVNDSLGGIGFDIFGNTPPNLINDVQGTNTLSIGFVRKDSDGTWYTRAADGTGFTENLLVVSQAVHTFRVEYDPGNVTPQARFYLDGVLVDTITTDLPTAAADIIGFTCGNGTTSGINTQAMSDVTAPSFAVEL